VSRAAMDSLSGWLWDDVKVAFERVHCPLERDVGRMAGQALSIDDSASHLQCSHHELRSHRLVAFTSLSV
jgi:hypothetical protein